MIKTLKNRIKNDRRGFQGTNQHHRCMLLCEPHASWQSQVFKHYQKAVSLEAPLTSGERLFQKVEVTIEKAFFLDPTSQKYLTAGIGSIPSLHHQMEQANVKRWRQLHR